MGVINYANLLASLDRRDGAGLLADPARKPDPADAQVLGLLEPLHQENL
jgi:hypothetical protein